MSFSPKQLLLWCSVAIFCIAAAIVTTLHLSGVDLLSSFQSGSSSKAYRHFGEAEAAVVCDETAHERFEGELQQASVDWHSTRYEAERRVYIVVLKGLVGSLTQNDQATIYCYVNPKSQTVTYFKAYGSDNQPLLSRGINMDAIFNGLKRTME